MRYLVVNPHDISMAKELFVQNDVLINASTSAVWDALVNPGKTKQYMYGSETVSDWKVGSRLDWKGVWEGKEMIFVTGNILEIAPYHRLVYTTLDPNNPTIADAPENYLRVTYLLEDIKGQTRLTVTQGDYTKVAEGQKRYDDAVSAGGWSSILEAIKTLVEHES